MKRLCLNCEKAGMVKGKRDITARLSGFSEVVPAVYGWHCPHCGEVEFLDDDGSNRFEGALDQLASQQRLWLRATRKKLKLTQAEAAAITGGGVNAFSRYERGEAKPMAAVVNLFRVLEKHPELLNRGALYTEGLDRDAFISDGLTYDATLRNLELIGEAATRIPKSVREKYPEIPWRMIIATRNRLIHAYLGIDNDTVWSIIQQDIPELLHSLQTLK